MIKKTYILILLMFLSTMVQVICAPSLSPEDTKNIKKILSYWNQINYLKAEFTQSTKNLQNAQENGNTFVTGILYINKKNKEDPKLRIDYEKALQQRVMIKDNVFLLIDLSDGSLSSYPLSMTPAYMILSLRLEMDKNVFIQDYQKQGEKIRLQLTSTKDDKDTTLTLFVNCEHGIVIEGWEIVENMMQSTLVHFTKQELENKILVPDSLFEEKV